MAETPMPFESMEAALQESGAMHVIEIQAADIERKDALLGKFATQALNEIGKHPVKAEREAAYLFSAAAIDYPETGQVAPDTQAEAMAKMGEAAQLSWQERARLTQGAGRGIG